jgi:hypothetical protein
MDKSRETPTGKPEAAVADAWQGVGASFERFCLTAGVSVLRRMMEHDAALAELQGQISAQINTWTVIFTAQDSEAGARPRGSARPYLPGRQTRGP